MITRLWRGWTTSADADAYQRFLLEDLFPSMRSIAGFRGAEVLRRQEDDEVGFVTLTRFASLEDVRVFAGHAWEVPVIEPRAAELLARYDERTVHYESTTWGTGREP